MDDAEADVGEALARNILRKSHAFAAFSRVLAGAAEVLGDELDGLEVEHIGHFPGGLGDVAFDGVGESVHAGGGGQAAGHGGHHVGVNDGDFGDVVGVDADELALLFHVGDDVVDGDFGGGAGGGRDGDGEDGVILGGSNAFKASDVREFGVVGDDADGLGGVHGGAAADSDDGVRARFGKGLAAGLDVFNGRVGLDLAEEGIGDTGGVEDVAYLFGDAELHKVGVRAEKNLFAAAAGEFIGDLGDRALAVVGNGVQNDTVCHEYFLLVFHRGGSMSRRTYSTTFQRTYQATMLDGKRNL